MSLLSIVKHLPGRHAQKKHGKAGSAKVRASTDYLPGYWENPSSWSAYIRWAGIKENNWVHGLYDTHTKRLILPGRAQISNAYHMPLIRQYAEAHDLDPDALETRSVRFSIKLTNSGPVSMFYTDRAGVVEYSDSVKAVNNVHSAMTKFNKLGLTGSDAVIYADDKVIETVI